MGQRETVSKSIPRLTSLLCDSLTRSLLPAPLKGFEMPKSPDISLQLHCSELDDSRLQTLTYDLTKSLRGQDFCTVKTGEKSPEAGKKGDPVAIGTVILTLIGSGGVAVKLIDMFRPYFERKPQLKVEFSRPDGKKVVIAAESVSTKQLRETSQMLDRFFES